MVDLLAIMARLRGPDGCPWDREQDFASIAPYTIEEAYEVADAIARNDLQDLKDELGDLLLQVVFHAQMADEQSAFNFNDVAAHIAAKMRRRHPHVFGAVDAENAAAVKDVWEAEKERERAAKDETSVLDGVALNLPALLRAQKLSKRAARAGFDWDSISQIFDKLLEEKQELEEAIEEGADPQHLEEELGDMLFVMVNLARRLDIEAETALRNANAKFERRFRSIEQQLVANGSPLGKATMDQMQSAWDAVKRAERS
ncbi:MAG: nucleoside triphosphate pyrophosphohydrolase [Pseudomonadota bacterium]